MRIKLSFCFAALVLLLAVLCNVNGSSIRMWNRFVPNPEHEEKPLFGKARGIRSDEWAVFTPLTVAQSQAGYPYFNPIPRGATTDMFSVYAQPVKDPLLVFRPFLSGFMMFGFERGLAFFWAARWLALILVMYELFKLLTGDDRLWSAVGATMVLFSPAVQWWGAINALAEMLIFGGLSILMLRRFLLAPSARLRILPAAVIAYCAVAYAMTLYPAEMVPLGYVFLALAIGVIARYGKGFRFDAKTLAVVSLAGFAAAAALAWYLWKSQDAFRLCAETVYPGQRFSVGGDALAGFGNSWGGLFLPYSSKNLIGNQFERSAFIDFFPLGFFFGAWVMAQRRKIDPAIVCLMIASAMIFVYSAIGYPEWLAKCTFMGKSTGPRAVVAFGFSHLLLLLRSVSLLDASRCSWRKVLVASFAFAVFCVVSTRLSYGEYLKVSRCFAVFAASMLGCVCFLRRPVLRWWGAAFLVVLMLVAGLKVNPLQHGSAGVFDSSLVAKIREIVKADDALWLVDESPFPLGGYPILGGARTINSVNTYPVPERWRMIDPDGASETVWNRYAHIRAIIKPAGPTEFTLLHDDYFRLDISNEDVARLGVRYVMSPRELEGMSDDNVEYKKVASECGFNIYCVFADLREPHS